MDNKDVYDVAIIGGGIVGCASLFHFTNMGYKCVLLEKNKHLVTGASAGNRFVEILNLSRISNLIYLWSQDDVSMFFFKQMS